MSRIRIAVIDSGIFVNHPVFDNVNIGDYSFDNVLELSRYVQSETPKNLSFNDKALDLRSGA